jgi:hypothetical protein
MQTMQPCVAWYLEWPYWDSAPYDPVSGFLIPVFHWAIKKMSDYGVDDGFRTKVKACLQVLNERSTSAEPGAATDRGQRAIRPERQHRM